MNTKERARDKRLKSTYGISLEQYNQILAAQDGKCATCHRPATDFSVSLAVDHEHFKVNVCRVGKYWHGMAVFQDKSCTPLQFAKTKAAAIALIKKTTMPYSVRGLLCPGRHGPAGTCCNRNMGRIDNPVWLRSVLAYLEDPPARKVLTF